MSNAALTSVVLLRRQGDRRAAQIAALVLANLEAVSEDLVAGAIVVLEADRVRVRRLPPVATHLVAHLRGAFTTMLDLPSRNLTTCAGSQRRGPSGQFLDTEGNELAAIVYEQPVYGA